MRVRAIRWKGRLIYNVIIGTRPRLFVVCRKHIDVGIFYANNPLKFMWLSDRHEMVSVYFTLLNTPTPPDGVT